MKEKIELLSEMLKAGYSIDQVKRECWQYCLSQSIGSATLESAILSAMSMFSEIMARNLPVLDSSETIMDEALGRNAGLEWKEGSPDMSGAYVIITRIMGAIELYDQYDPDDEYWDIDEVLWHIGPIPPVPQNDEE